MRIGHGFDAHRLVQGRKFILAGIEIPCDRGPLGHSDADALAHAISDAMLGAAALGDLGTFFPDTDARWKDASSLDLLAQCVQKVHDAGFVISNVDATVILEAPKLAPHIALMRASLAGVLKLPIEAVSVKAKTSEGMGYTGDGSGIAVHALACVIPRDDARQQR